VDYKLNYYQDLILRRNCYLIMKEEEEEVVGEVSPTIRNCTAIY
jgi:hypothetical protein